MISYRCIACAAEQPANYTGFLCPTCGNNLDIRYDYAAAAEELQGGFGGGARQLFRYQTLLPVRRAEARFPLRIGGTPLYPAQRLGP